MTRCLTAPHSGPANAAWTARRAATRRRDWLCDHGRTNRYRRDRRKTYKAIRPRAKRRGRRTGAGGKLNIRGETRHREARGGGKVEVGTAARSTGDPQSGGFSIMTACTQRM